MRMGACNRELPDDPVKIDANRRALIARTRLLDPHFEPRSRSVKLVRGGSKTTGAFMIKQRGTIMLALILNAIDRQFLQAALLGISNQGSKAMTEAFTATCLFLSIGVFLAHAFVVCRMR
jgi:hypothetical protein